MMLPTTQRGLLGLIFGLVVGWPGGAALAQQPPTSDGADRPQQDEQATSQPAQPSSTQEALNKLLKLRDQMQREQGVKEREGQPNAGRNVTSPRRPVRGVGRPEHARPEIPASAPVTAPGGVSGPGRPTLEELQARARASTQRAAAQSLQPAQPPPDFVGPPISLANPALPTDEAGASGQTPSPAQSEVAPPPAEGAVSAPAGPEPREPRARRPALDEKSEWFQFEKMPWEDVIAHFVERIGKPLLQEDVIIGGELTYKSDRKFTKDEAIDELNLIMHEKGYRFVEEEYHVRIIPLAEMAQHVDLKLVYPTVAAFEKANPRDMDYVTVYYQVEDRPAQVYVDMFSDALPDYARLSALVESNQIKINALARDVRKFLTLKGRISIEPSDPREMKIFNIKTNAADIEQRVRSFLRIGGGPQQPQVRMVREPRTGQMVAQQVPGGPSAEGEVLMVADERTNSIIVKATREKINEIADLIKTLDEKPDIGEFKTEVIEIKHADAVQVATLLNEIFRQEQGQAFQQMPNWQQQQILQQQIQERIRRQQMQRGQQPGQPPQPQQPVPMQFQPGAAPESILAEGIFERAKKTIRLVADQRMNALIVYANAEGQARVREMLLVLDAKQSDNFQTFALLNAKVADVAPVLTQIVNGMVQVVTRTGRSGPIIVPDEVNNVFYVLAERDDMERIEQLIRQLDVAGPEQERHVVELKNLRPSDVAQMVQTLLGSGGGGGGRAVPSAPMPPGGRVRSPMVPTSPPRVGGSQAEGYQVIPLDQAQVLIVLCSPEDWAKIEQTIQMWDERAITNTPRLESFAITKGNAQTIANTLAGFYRMYVHPVLGQSPVGIQADGDKVLVYGIQPALEEIGALIESMDVESVSDKVEILPLVNADAAQVAQQAQALFVRPGPRGAAGGPLIQAEAVTNSLIVQADKTDLEKIKDFAMQMDQRIGAQATEQRFYPIRYAQPQEVATAVQNIFGQRTGPRGAAASQVRAMPAGDQVVVEAPKDKFTAIEAFIKQLDDPKGNEMVVKTVKLPGSDVNQVAQNLSAAVRTLQRPGRPQANFIPDVTTETIIVSAPSDMLPKIDELVATFVTGTEDMTLERRFYPIQIADAAYVADLLGKQLSFQVAQRKGQVAASRISISADPRQNQVIVSAPKFVHPLAEELIKGLDKEATGEVPPVTIVLKHADPGQVVQLINAMYAQRGGQGQSKQQEVQAVVANGMLVVRAPKSRMDEVRALVDQVDAGETQALQIRTFPLKVINAMQVAVQAQLYLRSIAPPQRGGQLQPSAFAEPTTNTLIVIAPAEHLPLIEGLVQKLETAERPESGAQQYVLKNARAEQVAQNIGAMLQAKVAEREGPARKDRFPTMVVPDAAGNRLFVYASEEYQKLAAELIKMVDQEVTSGEIVHIIPLENGDAQQVVQSLNQVIQGRGGAAGGRGGATSVRVVADTGSNSILLSGLPKDVAEVERWLKDLEVNSVRVPEMQVFRLEYAATKRVEDAVKAMFGGSKNPLEAVTVSADEYSGELLVTANKRKMRQVEAVIKELDRAPAPEEEDRLPGNRELHFVDVYRGKASDIAWDLRDLLPSEKEGGPSIESDWFDQYLIVKCRPAEFPKIEKLIRQLDARAKQEVKYVILKPRDLQRILPYLEARGESENFTIEKAIAGRKLESMVEEVRPEGDEPPSVKDKHDKPEREKGERGQSDRPKGERDASGSARKVIPFETGLRLPELLLDDIEAELYGAQSAPPAAPTPAARSGRAPAAPGPVVRLTAYAAGPGADELSHQEAPRVAPLPASTPRKAAPEDVLLPRLVDRRTPSTEPTDSGPVREREKTRVFVQEDGTLLIQGPKDDVDEIKKTVDLLEEDLTIGEVIRIFHFKYGDVSAAAEILSMMFDVQPRQIVIQQPQQPQQPQQRGQPGQPGQPGRPGEEGRQPQGGIMDQLRGMIGGQRAAGGRAAGQRMRIATDPGHNYLIVKCDEADLPDIRRLLRELDIPPGEVQIKIFQLKNLSAEETAQNIADVLGISKAQQRRTGGGRAGQPRPGLPPQMQQQQQLIEMLQQQLVSVPGVEGGAKVERVEIVPNSITNSLLVSAPPEVMSLIEKVIDDLENLEGRDVVGIYQYPLKNAQVDDILPLLQEIFASAAGTGGAGGGGPAPGMPRAPRGGGGASPAALGPVTISGDPRNNTIIFTAQAKDQETVERHIRMLDIEGAVAEAEMYVCRHGDAEAIAAAVEAIYGGGGAARAGARGPRGAAAGAESDVRIASDATTNTILVWGPLSKRDVIFAKIEELDKLNERDIREIAVKFADPEKLAETLSEVFAASGAQPAAGRPGGARRTRAPGGAGGGPGGASVLGGGRIMILGDKAAKKLLVRAPDEIYTQITQLVATLDQPSEQMKLKRFQLKYADAEAVVDSVKQAMTEYLQLAKTTGTETDFDAFTAVPDARTNSVTVVGSDKTFLFVSEVLKAVDVVTPPDQKKEFRIFMLEKADAATVADAINAFAAGGGPSAGGGARPAGRRGGTPGLPAGAAGAAGRELNVTAIAEETSNSVMVIGRKEDIDTVEDAVIAELEQSLIDRLRIDTITVQNVPPSEIVSFISLFMTEGQAPAGGPAGRGGRAPAEQAGPQIVPNDNAKTLVVRGTKRQIDEVRDLVERFDDKTLVQPTIKVIEIPIGQDAATLAAEVQQVVNQNEEELALKTGRQARRVVVVANQFTNALIVAGDPQLFGQAEMIVRQLNEVRSPQVVTRVVELKNLSAQDAEQLINQLQRPGGTTGRAGGGIRPTGGGGGGTRTPAVRPPSSTGGRSTPGARPAQPSGGSRPQPPAQRPPTGGGGGRRAPGGGSSMKLDETPDRAFALAPVAWLQPNVATGLFMPVVSLLRAGGLIADDQPQQERQQPASAQAPREEPATKPAARPRTAREEALRAIEEELAGTQPVTAPAPIIEEGLTGVSGALRGEVAANAIDSQRLIITGDEKDVEFIEQILAMMEQTAMPAEVEVFALQEAKAAALAPIIDKAVQAWIGARTSRPGPADKFSINAEVRSNSLIVSASVPIMEKIAELVERLDIKKGGVGTDVKTVALLHIRASEAVAILRPTIEKLNTMRDVPKDSQASIDAIDRDNSVMIIGTPNDIREIESWLKSIDVELATEQKEASFVTADAIVIQLKNGLADDIAKVLNEMIKAEQEAALAGVGGDRKTAGKLFVKKIRLRLVDGRELPELNLERPIKLVPEKGTNSLIIFSTKDNNEALTAIVDLFDTLPIGADTDVKAFALRHASAEAVAKLIEDTFKDKSYLNRPSEGEGKGLQKGVLPPVPPGVAAKGLPYPLVVQHDTRSNTVLVIGRKDAVLLAGGLISELDRPTIDLGVKSYVLQLKSAHAAQLTDKLKKLMDERTKALGGDKGAARDNAVIQADERSNRLIVLATEEVYDMIEDLVLQLDASEKYSIVDVRYRTLQRADAVKLKNMLDEAFKSKKEADAKINKESADTLSVLADTRSNSLLLTGTRDYLDEAETLITQLDQEFSPTVVFKARKVRLNSAANVASLLKEMVEKALAQKDSKLSGTPIHVAADPVSDTLLMAAAREDMEVLDRWIEILDRPSEVGRMTRIIPLQRAVAEDVSKAVQDIFKVKGGTQKGGEIDVTVSADKTTNSIVAFGPPALLTDIEDFVKRIDSTEATKGTIVKIFRLEQAAAQDAGDLLARILDLRGGSVGGTGGGGAGGGTRQEAAKQVMLVFQKQHPELGLETFKAVRSDVVVISDVRTNSLVITAPPDSMELMESLVAAVDVPPQDAKIRVFRLRNSDAEQMVKTLEALFQRKSATTTGRAGGAGEQPERVLTLEGMGGEGGRQEVAFTTDVRTNSLIAAGTPGYLSLAEQTILELDTIPIEDRDTFVYPPRNIKADTLVPSLKEFSDAEQKRLQDIGKDVSVGVRQSRQITAIANKDANRVIVSVDPRFKESVMSVIRELDQPPPQVMIQVLIVEVTMENSLDLGVEFAFQDLQWAKAGVQDTTTFDYVVGTDIGAAGSGMGGFTFTITGADFNFLFRTLQSENNLQVLSRPQIVAMDNQEAIIEVSNDVPYVTGTATTTGGVVSTSVARQKVGIQLTVKPQINPDGYVRMDIDQKVDDFTGSTVQVGPGVTAPIFFTRQAKTTVSIKDNETVVLGGLITSRTENKETKVPLVGDIPGLGLLFRSQSDTTKRTELLVVLTPHVIRTVEDYRAVSAAERDTMNLIPGEILSDPLMQGLRISPETGTAEEGAGEELVPREVPAQKDYAPESEEYGPLRPAIRGVPTPGPDANSYDVPLSYRAQRRE